MQLKKVPLLLFFCLLVAICGGAFGLAGYVTFIKESPTEGQLKHCDGLMALGVLAVVGAGVIAYFAHEEW